MSRDCCVALSRGAMGLQFVIVVFPDHTHLVFYLKNAKRKNVKLFDFLFFFKTITHCITTHGTVRKI